MLDPDNQCGHLTLKIKLEPSNNILISNFILGY